MWENHWVSDCRRQQNYIYYIMLNNYLNYTFVRLHWGKIWKFLHTYIFTFHMLKFSALFSLFRTISNFSVKNNPSSAEHTECRRKRKTAPETSEKKKTKFRSRKCVGSWDRFSISLLLFRKLIKLPAMIYDLNSWAINDRPIATDIFCLCVLMCWHSCES